MNKKVDFGKDNHSKAAKTFYKPGQKGIKFLIWMAQYDPFFEKLIFFFIFWDLF